MTSAGCACGPREKCNVCAQAKYGEACLWRRESGLGDEWLAGVIARLRAVELTEKQALDLMAAAMASVRR